MFSFLDPKEDAIEKSKFLTAFCKGVTEQNNMLHLDQLGAELSEKVLQYWMANINRSLSNYQVRDHPYITPAKVGWVRKIAIFADVQYYIFSIYADVLRVSGWVRKSPKMC